MYIAVVIRSNNLKQVKNESRRFKRRMTILEHIEEEKQKLSKLDGVELEREYIQLQQSVSDRLDRLMKEKGLIKVIHSHNKITGVINLDDAKW